MIMGIRGDKNSHIQLPASVINEFSQPESFINSRGFKETHQYTYCLHRDLVIEKLRVDKEANTEKGYYENPIEEDLSIIETHFGRAKNKVLELKDYLLYNKNIPKEKTIFSELEILSIVKYCSICWMRSPVFAKAVEEKSFAIKAGLIANEPQNIVLMQYFNDPDIVDRYFSDMNMTFIINNSNVDFILPQIGFVSPKTFDENQFEVYIPIHPKAAIYLTHKEVIIDGSLVVYCVGEHDVDYINKLSINNEFHNNVGNIYAENEADILRYKEFYTPRTKK